MRKPRKFVLLGTGTRHFHAMSRIVNRDFVIGIEEKEFFRKTLRKLEAFSGVHILTYCVMSNHFHLLVEIPERTTLSDEEVCQRMSTLYSKMAVNEFRENLIKARRDGDLAFADLLRKRLTCRMNDLSMFMKDLKQRFTQWYNRRHGRRGTLWEERYRALLVEGSKHALLTIASYIDLNPVRAGICEDPKDYRFCGYSEAIGGSPPAREGLKALLLGYDGVLNWQKAAQEYRKHLFEVDDSKEPPADVRYGGPGFNRQQALQVLATKGDLKKWEFLRCRVRYFTDGAVLGSQSFVDHFFENQRSYFGPNRKSGPRKIYGSNWGNLFTVRNLQINRIS
ncbi:MAG: hypothetical protein HOH33_11890 [Verrucomicrobia bacterium]|nr:hypothetical protein [Verrucomicrobiota bacterium]